MPKNSIIINGFILNAETMADFHNLALGKDGYLPKTYEEKVALPISLLRWMFGIRDEWLTEEEFVLQRQEIRMLCSLGSNKAYYKGNEVALPFAPSYDGPVMLPLETVCQVFGLTACWIKGALSITDPVTKPFYELFGQRYSPLAIQEVFLVSSGQTDAYDCYISYSRKQNMLALAGLSANKTWFLDDLTESRYLNEMRAAPLGESLAILLNARDDLEGFNHSLYVYKKEVDNKPVLIEKFKVFGYFMITEHDISVIERLSDSYRYGLEKVFRWEEGTRSFHHQEDQLISYDRSKVFANLRSPESIASAFCSALVCGQAELAHLLCVDEIDSVVISELLASHKKDSDKDSIGLLHLSIWHYEEDKIILFTYYGDINLKYLKRPSRVIRMVLIRNEGLWKIAHLTNLSDNLPLRIFGLEVTPDNTQADCYVVDTCSNETEASLIRVIYKGAEFDLTVCSVCLQDTLPGIRMSFFSGKDKEPVLSFAAKTVEEVEIWRNPTGSFDIKLS